MFEEDSETCNQCPLAQVSTLVQGLARARYVATSLRKVIGRAEQARLLGEVATSHTASAAPGTWSSANCPQAGVRSSQPRRGHCCCLPTRRLERTHQAAEPRPSCKGCWESELLHFLHPHGRETLLPVNYYKEGNVPGTEGMGGRDLKKDRGT